MTWKAKRTTAAIRCCRTRRRMTAAELSSTKRAGRFCDTSPLRLAGRTDTAVATAGKGRRDPSVHVIPRSTAKGGQAPLASLRSKAHNHWEPWISPRGSPAIRKGRSDTRHTDELRSTKKIRMRLTEGMRIIFFRFGSLTTLCEYDWDRKRQKRTLTDGALRAGGSQLQANQDPDGRH